MKSIVCLMLVACIALAGVALAQGDDYDLTWYTVDGGGVTWSTGGGYTLGGTAGQADAGTLSGGGYLLAGGFWTLGAAPSVGHEIYLPLILRSAG